MDRNNCARICAMDPKKSIFMSSSFRKIIVILATTLQHPVIYHCFSMQMISPIASSPVTMYDATIKWLDWARMQVKVPKCRALSINRGRAVTQSSLKLDGESVPSASEAPIRFLDVPTLNTINHCTALAKQLKLYLLKIDKTTVTRRQKLKLYQLAVCAKLSCDLSVHQIPLSWVERVLDTKYIKKWSGLARPANPAHLFLSKGAGGLGYTKMSVLYQELHLSKQVQLMLSRDPCMRYLSSRQVRKDEQSTGLAFCPAL